MVSLACMTPCTRSDPPDMSLTTYPILRLQLIVSRFSNCMYVSYATEPHDYVPHYDLLSFIVDHRSTFQYLMNTFFFVSGSWPPI